MPQASCIIIDDIDASLTHLSENGRKVISASARRIRDSVLEYAERRRWAIVAYESYVRWAREFASRSNALWLVADPLFPSNTLPNATAIRVSRGYPPGSYDIGGERDARASLYGSERVGILDDAAGTGGTIRALSSRVASSGGMVSEIVVCASTRTARESTQVRLRAARWTSLIPGDWRICHLRDGCPFLPFTGRKTAQGFVDTADIRVDVRSSVTHDHGNLWQVLYLDPSINAAIHSAYSTAALALSDLLGRPATVADLPVLGADVPASIVAGEAVAPTTRLMSLIGAS
jgi:hypothetical protein